MSGVSEPATGQRRNRDLGHSGSLFNHTGDLDNMRRSHLQHIKSTTCTPRLDSALCVG